MCVSCTPTLEGPVWPLSTPRCGDARIAAAPNLTAAGDLMEQAFREGADIGDMLRAHERRTRTAPDTDDLQRVARQALADRCGSIQLSPSHPDSGSVSLHCEVGSAFRYTVESRLEMAR